MEEWNREILEDSTLQFSTVRENYNVVQGKIEHLFNNSGCALLQSKHIIGCTMTVAAMYRDDINAAQPDVLLMEEAGEILESHILMALGAKTKHLILIGDHKCTPSSHSVFCATLTLWHPYSMFRQLHPKVYSYSLMVEKGESFDLNCSLLNIWSAKAFLTRPSCNSTACAQKSLSQCRS